MKPSAFDYVRADSTDEALALLAEYGDDARILAGGQSLVAMLNMRLLEPKVVIDITRVPELADVKIEDERLVIGAAVTQAAVERRGGLLNEVPLLQQAFPHIGHFQTRNRGTVCGSLAHADPSAELPLCLLLLDGDVVLRSRRRTRTVAAADFLRGMLQTAREPDEMITAARYPLQRPDTRYGFIEVAQRHGDFALVALAAAVDDKSIRLAVGGVGGVPQVVEWTGIAGDDLAAALNEFAWRLDAQDDAHASAVYRRHLVRTLGRQLVERLQ
ncbi:MAG TPA: FAD binding domain-containing protein [Burkholderiales bacterium]|nr:FAD binding domain-containing protein [Burkholderiales bacterium]